MVLQANPSYHVKMFSCNYNTRIYHIKSWRISTSSVLSAQSHQRKMDWSFTPQWYQASHYAFI